MKNLLVLGAVLILGFFFGSATDGDEPKEEKEEKFTRRQSGSRYGPGNYDGPNKFKRGKGLVD